MTWLTVFFSGFFASLGWAVLFAAIGAALLVHLFGKAVPSWVPATIIVALGVAFIGLSAAKDAQIARLKLDAAATAAKHAQDAAATANAVTALLTAQREADRLRAAAAQASDTKHQKELTRALNENRGRAGDPARYGMRFAGATCPQPAAGDPAGQAGAAGVGAGAGEGVEVVGDARRAVSDLREEVLTDRQALKALADWAALD